MSIEHRFIPEEIVKPKQEQKEIEPTFVETHELKDKEGNVICNVEVIYAKRDPEPVKWAFRDAVGREVKTFVLEKEGKRIDLVNLLELKSPIRIFESVVDSDRNYRFNFEGQTVFVPPLTHPIGMAIALHELGHAKQNELPFFRELVGMRNRRRTQIFLGMSDYRDHFKKLEVMYPELKDRLPDESVLAQLDEIREEARPILENKKRWRKTMDQIARLRQEIDEPDVKAIDYHSEAEFIMARNELARKKLEIPKQLLELNEIRARLWERVEENNSEFERLEKAFRVIARPLDQVLLASTRVAERDATRRAFQWMKKAGDAIDANLLSTQTEVSDSYKERVFTDRNLCVESTKRVANNIERFGGFSAKGALLRGLTSYDAFEKIPVPSLKRLEQMEREEEEKQKSSGT